MVGPIYNGNLDVHGRVSSQAALAHGLQHTLFDSRDELPGDCSPEHLVLKDPTSTTCIWFHINPAMTELTMATSLLLVLALHVCLALDRLTVWYARYFQVDVHTEFLLKTLHNNLKMGFTQTAENGLVGLGVLVDHNGRFFFLEPAQGGTQFVVVSPGLWFERTHEEGRREYDGRQVKRGIFGRNRVVRRSVHQFRNDKDVPGDSFICRFLLLPDHMKQATDLL